MNQHEIYVKKEKEDRYPDPVEVQKYEGNVTLVIKDDSSLIVPKNIIGLSIFIREMSKNIKNVVDVDDIMAPVPIITNLKVLEKIVEFCEHYVNSEKMTHIEKPLKSSKMSENVQDWYANFVDEMETSMLLDVILAANFMDIQSLLDLTCAKVASIIKGHTPDEIRQKFGIVNDFTPEEEEKIKNENKWIME